MWTRTLQRLWINEKSAVAAEYAILVALIAMGALAGMTFFGRAVQRLFEEAAAKFPQ